MALSFQPARDPGSEAALWVRKPGSAPCRSCPAQVLPPGGTRCRLLPAWCIPQTSAPPGRCSPWSASRRGQPSIRKLCRGAGPPRPYELYPHPHDPFHGELDLASHERGRSVWGHCSQTAFGHFCCWASCKRRQVAEPKQQGPGSPAPAPPLPSLRRGRGAVRALRRPSPPARSRHCAPRVSVLSSPSFSARSKPTHSLPDAARVRSSRPTSVPIKTQLLHRGRVRGGSF